MIYIVDTVIASRIQKFADHIARYTGQFIQMQKLLFCKKILKIYVNGRRTGRWSLMLNNVSPFI